MRYLDALLTAELEEREERLITRRLFEAKLPRLQTLDEFDFKVSPMSMPQMRELAEGGYLERAEPVLFLGETGTGKTHLMTALCVQACQQCKRARFISAASLINELVEAQRNGQLSRALHRWKRWELLCIDEMGYVPLEATGAELLFQVITKTGGEAGINHHDELALFRVVHRVSQCTFMQGAAGPGHRSRPHRRNRHGVLPFPADCRKTEKEVRLKRVSEGACRIDCSPVRATGTQALGRVGVLGRHS